MKDNFSIQSEVYASFRPTYPPALAEWIAQQVDTHQCVWDCATGNGQMATLLAPYFERVFATDLSEKQLQLAKNLPNIQYHCEPAHHCTLPQHSADAVVIAQAIHWFNFEAFYKEVHRVVRPGGIIAAIGYALPEPESPAIRDAVQHFYSVIVGPYWDPERWYIDERYETIPFPFENIAFPRFPMEYQWDKSTLAGYLNSWSAVQHFIKKNDYNPVTAFANTLNSLWPDQETIPVHFSILGKIGRV